VAGTRTDCFCRPYKAACRAPVITYRLTFYLFTDSIRRCAVYVVEPNFVSSYEVGDYVYVFFRETAVEYINCGKVGS